MRGHLVYMFALAMACGETRPPAAPLPESAPVAVTSVAEAPVTGSDPTYDAPGAVEPFDFWRVLLDSEVEGTEQLCVAARVADVSNPERHLMPSQRRRTARLVSCVRSSYRDIEAANVVVLVPDSIDVASVVPSTRDRRADDVETRLRLRALGVDARGETVIAELLSVHRVVQAGDDDPTRPPSRCCRDGERGDRDSDDVEAPGPQGFDFDEWHGHVGTRQLCVAQHPSAPRRTQGVEPAPISIPENVVVMMYALCDHASGRHRTRLLFTEAMAARAQWVGTGSLVHGYIDGGGDLIVDAVRGPPDERRR